MKASNKWGKREEHIAKILGLKRVAMSGAGMFDKEDMVGNNIRAQLKSTEGESIKIQKSDVLKLFMHSRKNELSVFVLDFVDGPLLVSMPFEQLVLVAEALINSGALHLEQNVQAELQETMDFNLDDVI